MFAATSATGVGADRPLGPRAAPNPDVVPDSERTDPAAAARGGVTAAEYLHALRSVGSCIQDEMSHPGQSVQVELPAELDDEFGAEYRVLVVPDKPEQVSGPQDSDGFDRADLRCRQRHLGNLEQTFQEAQLRDRAPAAIAQALECLGAEPTDDQEQARSEVEAALRSGGDVDCVGRLVATALFDSVDD